MRNIISSRYLMVLTCLCLSLMCWGQSDSNNILQTKILKKGFYKDYDEFKNNAPSILKDFTVIKYNKSKSDTEVIGADYHLKDTLERVHGAWGFCDGSSVYVSYSPSILSKRFWRLEYIGHYSIFSFAHKDIYALGPPLIAVITAAASAGAPPLVDLMIINERGKCVHPDIALLKKLLSKHLDLLQNFNAEIAPYRDWEEDEPEEKYEAKMGIIKKYLVRLNEALK